MKGQIIMSRNKSIFVTLVMAAMLAVILAGAYKIETRAFFGLLAVLAGYGFIRGSGDLCRWMQRKEAPAKERLEEPETDPFAHDDEMEGSARMSFGWLDFREGVFSDGSKSN